MARKKKPTNNVLTTPTDAGDVCPGCALIGVPGALCPAHAALPDLYRACRQYLDELKAYQEDDGQMYPDFITWHSDAVIPAVAKAEGK
jgi:hypothetical protein